jgi:hypothetical protein
MQQGSQKSTSAGCELMQQGAKTGAMETAAAASGSHPSSLLLIRFSFW